MTVIQFLHSHDPFINNLFLSVDTIYVTENWKIQIYPVGFLIQSIPAIDLIRYSAPELLLPEPKPHNNSDIYQWGLVFYEMATHSKPYYEFEDADDLLKTILFYNRPKPPQNVFVPKYLDNLFTRCWDKDCSLRINTNDFLNQYKEIQILNDNFEETRNYWTDVLSNILIGSDNKISWNEFFPKFCDYFKIYIERKSNCYYSLKYAFFTPGNITPEDFATSFFWLTDSFTPTWGMVKSIIENIQYNWFCAKANTQNEESLVKKKKRFFR